MAETVDEAARRVAMMTNVVPMAPVNPGAFSGMGSTSDAEMAALMEAQRGMQNTAPMPNAPMPEAGTPTPVIDPTNQNSMMAYLQQKVKEIRERTGGNPQNMGSLEAIRNAMQPQMRQTGSGATSDAEMRAMQNAMQKQGMK